MESASRAAVKNSRWPAICAFLLLAILVMANVMGGLRVCAGHFGYPLDDTYIHMAMAKNFALHGVWGITRYGFTSSTSSPLFTLLLAVCYAVSGVHELTPFVLNCAAAVLVVGWVEYLLRRRGLPDRWRAITLVVLVVAVPLATMVSVSMEHVLHALLTLIFAHLCGERLAGARHDARAAQLLPIGVLLTLTVLLVTARYEGVFLTATAGLLFLIRGRWKLAAGLAAASAAPLLLYGWISMRHGWYPIPSSLLLKANLPSSQSTGMFGSFSRTLFVNFTQGSHLAALALAGLALLGLNYTRVRTIWTYSQSVLILFVTSAVLQLCLARVGWFFRYESYLIALGVVVSAVALYEFTAAGNRRLAIWIYVPVVLFAIPITYRFIHATFRTSQAISDIYCQQYQMGLFARDNLAGQPIVIADIGAVSFLSEARVLDLIGLGSLDSLRARVRKQYSTAWLAQWSRDSHAVAALTAVKPAPAAWVLVATWTIPDNYISGSDHVNIFAANSAEKELVAAMVDRFRGRIPPRVVQSAPASQAALLQAGPGELAGSTGEPPRANPAPGLSGSTGSAAGR